ncbi:MAG: aminofutalosine synthase MqnE, partial [Bacteroidota bacterium]
MTEQGALKNWLFHSGISTKSQSIADKIVAGERISAADCEYLYEKAELSFVGVLADHIRRQRHGLRTYFNR